jgi:2-polyprenyl-3-methyl-5-hydroxy-6-metoxy-1,4-benzoquinol methylase
MRSGQGGRQNTLAAMPCRHTRRWDRNPVNRQMSRHIAAPNNAESGPMPTSAILDSLHGISTGSEAEEGYTGDWGRQRISYTVDRLRKLLKPGDRVMDVASGPYFSYIMNRAVLDLTWLPTDVAKRTVNLMKDGQCVYTYTPSHLELRAGRQPLPHRELDAITFFETIEHLPWNPAPLLGDMNESLKDGGLLILSTPNLGSRIAILRLLGGGSPHQTPFFEKAETTFNFHKREYGVWEIRELVRWAGFDIVSHTTFNINAREGLTWQAAVHHLSLLLAAALSASPLEIRHLLRFTGSTQFVVAHKVRSPRWDVKPPAV